MTDTIPASHTTLLNELSQLISSMMGLHFPESRFADLERSVRSASADLGFSSIEEFTYWLKSTTLTRQHIETLAGHLTVGETYFFRDQDSFRALEEHVFPEFISARQSGLRRLRVWSAGCSTGEEPYSVAILLKRMLADLKNWNISILATDINATAIKKASAGVYSEWSFRGTPEWVKNGYFVKIKEGLYEISPEIKKMVSFNYLNLAEDVYPSLLNNTNAIDIIFCRNVIMYFSAEVAGRVIKGLHNSLMDDGYLLVSPAEALRTRSPLFRPVNMSNTTLYRKSEEMEEMRPAPPHYIPGPAEYKWLPPVKDDIKEERSANAVTDEPPAEAEAAPSKYDEAVSLFERGRYAEASLALEESALAGDNGWKVMNLLARACANQGRLDLAAKWCEKAISADTLNPVQYYLLATILQEQGRAEDAINYLKKALYLDHNFVLAQFVLGNLLFSRGDSGAAARHYRNALDLLSAENPEEVLPESDGVTAGRLKEIINSIIKERLA
ncbi:MAG: tetratricopeptide repeat protein [Deltaproteobacteria bacterium]|nr:tetratricopeptide repeat protein [Deltaproteobacteria bacterium]